jgi:hypothetical protein
MIGLVWGSVWLVRALLAGLGLPLLIVLYQWAERARLFEHEPVVVPARHRGDRPTRFDAA